MKTLFKISLGALFLMLMSAAPGWSQECNFVAPTVSLISDSTPSSGDYVFNYGVTVTGAGNCAYISDGSTITLYGMSGVTGASVEPYSSLWFDGLAVDGTPTSSTATFKFEEDPFFTTGTTGEFTIDCSDCQPGTVDYTIGGGDPTVTGPVAASTSAPEPGSLALLLTGLFAVFGLVAMKRWQVARAIEAA